MSIEGFPRESEASDPGPGTHTTGEVVFFLIVAFLAFAVGDYFKDHVQIRWISSPSATASKAP